MKKRWVFATLLAGVLALGIMGGTALAQGTGTSGNSPFKSFAARVAAILGVDEAKVQDAFKQAAKETQDEHLQQRLDAMVQNGRLTQEQADQLKQWYQSRPDVLNEMSPFGGMRGHGLHHGRMQGGPMMGGPGMYGMPHDQQMPPTSTPEGATNTSF